MQRLLRGIAIGSALTLLCGLAQSAPIALDDSLLDEVSAGGQYSYVDGGAYAEQGRVSLKASTTAHQNERGASVTRASLKVKAVGTGLEAYGYGESGVGTISSSGAGAAELDQGKIVIRVKTVAREKANGDTFTKTVVKVKAVGKA